MLPTTDDLNDADVAAEFVTDNSLEQEEYSAAVAEEQELNGANGNGNNEFETNMSEDDNVENSQVAADINENNEPQTDEEEVNDNLNESSSGSIDNTEHTTDNEQENNHNENAESDGDDDEDNEDALEADIDVEIVNLKKKAAAIRQKEREDLSSSDDEEANAPEMPAAFNDEWGSLNEPTNEQNDLSNDIDVYDVVPIDLSNDIAVNDAADLPINPDAEFIDVYGVQHQANSMPKFEKLSLDYQPPSVEDEEWSNTPAK